MLGAVIAQNRRRAPEHSTSERTRLVLRMRRPASLREVASSASVTHGTNPRARLLPRIPLGNLMAFRVEQEVTIPIRNRWPQVVGPFVGCQVLQLLGRE